MKTRTTIFLLSGVSLAVLHYLSLELYLYWRYLWLDIPMHILGGMTVALGYLALADLFPRWPQKLSALWPTLLFVLGVAVAWEVFELAIGVIFEEGTYVSDTISDLLVGLLGGVAGYYVGVSVNDMDLYG